MNVLRSLADYRLKSSPVLTIGNFDGLHRGHLRLLESVVQTAQNKGGTPMVLTFDPHPLRVLAPSTQLQFLIAPEEKLGRLADLGIELVLSIPFDRGFAALSPDDFVHRVLVNTLGVTDLFVGEAFAFGAGRVGRVPDLKRMGTEAGFSVHAVPPVTVDGEIVSSTRIRTLLQAGRITEASRCLGRLYDLKGTVLHGEQRGQKMGWPTANLRLPADRVIPPDGVYAALAVWKDRPYDAVAYIGTRPTFGVGERLLEVYLLDEQVSLYGEEIQVRFVDHLRDDVTFESEEELSARIGLDVKQARHCLKAISTAARESSCL